MQKTRKGYVKRYLLYHLREKGGTLLLGAVFLLGAVAGSRLMALDNGELTKLFGEVFVQKQMEGGFLALCRSAFLAQAGILAALFLLGFCAIGQPAAVFLLFYQGLGLGVTGTCMMYRGKEDFAYYAMAILPTALCFLALQIVSTRESLTFSLRFLQELVPGISSGGTRTFKVYVARFVLFFLLAAGCAVLSGALSMFVTSFLNL